MIKRRGNENFISFLIAALLFELCDASGFPTVCIKKLGCVQGTHMPGYQIKNFEAFMGLPYALPPIGSLRFDNPRPITPWNGILIAQKPKPDCVQKNYLLPSHPLSGEEDCLYLNVYRPIAADAAVYPVMVYIHGGGFFSGSASPLIHGPEYFMDTNEVILVTIAYRLGPLGFLSTGDESITGNFALKDQNLALKWVKNNIAAFRGDPNSVTIFGQSAGGASVHMHILSKASTGLFQKAIIMSGNAGAPFVIPISDPLIQARKTAEICKISNASNLSSTELAHALRLVDAETIVNSSDGLKYWDVDPLTNFRPVIESNSNAFLTESPSEIISSGNYVKVPWVTGFVPNEGSVRALAILENDRLRLDFNKHFDVLFEKLLELPKFSREKLDEKLHKIIDYYFHGKHELNNDTMQGFIDLISDRGFRHPLYQNIEKYVDYADMEKSPLFLYKFNYRGRFSYSQLYTGGNLEDFGVVHCDDLIYLFRSPLLFPDFEKNSTEAKVIQKFVGLFVTFAKSGKPKNTGFVKMCTKEKLYTVEDGFCDYTEIRNDGDSFVIELGNTFDVRSMKLWNEILEHDDSCSTNVQRNELFHSNKIDTL